MRSSFLISHSEKLLPFLCRPPRAHSRNGIQLFDVDGCVVRWRTGDFAKTGIFSQQEGLKLQAKMRDLLAEAFGEGPEGVLGGSIEGAAGGAVGDAVAAHGADVDDVTKLAPPRHVLQSTILASSASISLHLNGSCFFSHSPNLS